MKWKTVLFFMRTKLLNGQAVTNGGRVMAVTSVGANMNNALGKSYRNIRVIDYEGKYYRKDIGFDLREDVMEEQD